MISTLITLLSVPVLLNDLVWSLKKKSINRTINKQPSGNILTYCSIKRPGLNLFSKKISNYHDIDSMFHKYLLKIRKLLAPENILVKY